jgi:hypothetical protein
MTVTTSAEGVALATVGRTANPQLSKGILAPAKGDAIVVGGAGVVDAGRHRHASKRGRRSEQRQGSEATEPGTSAFRQGDAAAAPPSRPLRKRLAPYRS